jgi:heme-degrading monooxygenase HmoA
VYAVIFTSQLSPDRSGYADATERMLELCGQQPGFISAESVRDTDGRGITVCTWDSLESIEAWSRDPEHNAAQEEGRSRWYEEYDTMICKVL